MKKLILFLAFAAAASAQVYTVSGLAGGSGYTSAPTLTASGGSCTAEPTLTAAVASGAVTSVSVTFAGTGCATPPALAFSGGGGTGASATAVLLPATLVVLSAAPSNSNSAVVASVGGGYTAWQYECWLTVPKARVPFYAATGIVFRMPGTSQTSLGIASLIGVPSAIQGDMTAGVLTAYDDYVIVASSTSTTTVEATLVSACSTAQTNLNNWNPWAFYGSYYNGSTWTGQGVQ